MTKFSGVNKQTGTPVLGIILTYENLAKLLEGESIQFDCSSMVDLPTIEVFICAKEDDAVAVNDMKQATGLDDSQVEYSGAAEDPQRPKPLVN